MTAVGSDSCLCSLGPLEFHVFFSIYSKLKITFSLNYLSEEGIHTLAHTHTHKKLIPKQKHTVYKTK